MSREFMALVRKACAAELEFRAHTSNTRMTSSAIIDACYAYGGTNPEKVAALRAELSKGTQHLRSARAFVGQAYRGVIEGHYASGAPRDISRFAGMPSRDEARLELSEIGHNLWTAWCIAVEDAREKHPEVFGEVSDPLAWQHKLDELKTRRAELFQSIAEGFQPDDLEVSDIKPDGHARVALTIARHVPLGPLPTLGERLINHLLATDLDRWAVNNVPAKPVKQARPPRWVKDWR